VKLRNYFWLTNAIIICIMVSLLFFGSHALFILTYIIVFVILVIRTLLTQGRIRVKIGLFIVYSLILPAQILLYNEIVWFSGLERYDPRFWLHRLVCVIIIALPSLISRYVTVGKYAHFYLPSVAELGAIGFAELRENKTRIENAIEKAELTKERMSIKNLRGVIDDIPRHNSFSYVNNGSLTDEYFKSAAETMDDNRVYIVISNTGSAASEIISVFTNKQYNHASFSFDRELDTIISYNGGDRVYPPGLNPELMAFFKKKDDASILVYSLQCRAEQKRQIFNRIREINNAGSAYNILGLLTRRSYKPNIMFCSQFVYRILEDAGLAYFKKAAGKVEPTDLIELDYRRELVFEYEIRL
jgi:hypothetical protein